jgi:transposase
MSERAGVSAQIGADLLVQEKKLFNLWHQFRNGQCTRAELIQAVKPIQWAVLGQLQEAASLYLVYSRLYLL